MNQNMKAKPLLLALAVLLTAGGLWVGRTAWRTHRQPVTWETKSGPGTRVDAPADGVKPGRTLEPPDPNRRFRDLTPEQRVQLARQGPIGG